MLIFGSRVEAGATNGALTQPLRFVVQRWAELLDRQTPFINSAFPLLDAFHWTQELKQACQEYIDDGCVRHEDVTAAARTTWEVLDWDPYVGRWFPTEKLALAAAVKAMPPKSAWSRDQKNVYVEPLARAALAKEIPAFISALAHPTTGYLCTLLDALERQLKQPPKTRGDWLALDRSLMYLAAFALADGRSAYRLAVEIADEFSRAKDDVDAIGKLRAAVQRPERDFAVAVAIRGVAGIQSFGNFPCTPIAAPGNWTRPAYAAATNQLRRFVGATSGDGRGCVIEVPTTAFDAEDARARALTVVERLVDHLGAEYRLARFEIVGEVVVLDAASRKAMSVSTIPTSAVASARLFVGLSPEKLEPSFRYHSLSRAEDAPVIGAVHAWIACENLGQKAQALDKVKKTLVPVAAANFVSLHLPPLMFLAGSRRTLTACWNLLQTFARRSPVRSDWAQLERWLGVQPKGKSVNVDRWYSLLSATPGSAPTNLTPTASPAEAAAFLDNIVTGLGPLCTQRYDEVRWRLSSAMNYLQLCIEYKGRAGLVLTRVRRLRNRTVHRALTYERSAPQLGVAANEVLDAAYEVLGLWLTPAQEVWQSMVGARAYYYKHVAAWTKQKGGKLSIAPGRLIHP